MTLALLSIMMILSGCERNEQPEQEPDATPGVPYICQLPVVEHGKEAWVPGDKILFHGGSVDNQKIVTLTEADIIDDTLCTVDLSGLKPYKPKVGKSKFFAAYPADLASTTASSTPCGRDWPNGSRWCVCRMCTNC